MKLTTAQAAEKLKVGIRQIQKLIADGRLPAEKLGRDWFIEDEDLKLVEERPKTGRPKKVKNG